MEASEMSIMTETATGIQGEKKEEDDSRQKAVLVAICCGFLLALLLSAAVANVLDSHETANGDNEQEDVDGKYIIGNKGGGGGGKVTQKRTTTAGLSTITTTHMIPTRPSGLSTTTTTTHFIPTNPSGLSTATTTHTIPTKPSQPTTTITTTEVIPIKPSGGLSCISGGANQRAYLTGKEIFSFCKRLLGRMQWRIKNNRTVSDFDTLFLNGSSYTEYADSIFWAFSRAEVRSYSRGNLLRDCHFETWGFPLRRYGLSHMRLKELIQNQHVKVLLQNLGNLPAENFALGIENRKGDMKLLETLDISMFDGVGIIILTRHMYLPNCALTALWYDAHYLKFAKIFNKKVPQIVAISTSGGASRLRDFNRTGKGDCWNPTADSLFYNLCDSNITVDLNTGRYECKELWFAVETNETLKQLADYAKSAGFYNCGLDDIELYSSLNEIYPRNDSLLNCDRL